MAVISELIDAGLHLKQQGNHQAAIEHFRQLHKTYPDHARIMFELAGSWQSMGIPEQALPLYQRLMAMPKSQGLPPKEMPRLYTQMGACLRLLGQFTESLEIIEEGLVLYPDYRPLRAYRMFALHSAGYHQNAMIDALELMLQSLAPTKWDLYEEEIIDIVKDLRDRIPSPDTEDLADWVFDEYWTEEGATVTPESDDDLSDSEDEETVDVDEVLDEAEAITNGDETELIEADEEPPQEDTVAEGTIEVEDIGVEEDDEFEVEVKVIKKDKPGTKKSSSKTDENQFGKKPVKIDINATGDTVADVGNDEADTEDTPDTSSDDDQTPPKSGKINIPVDID